MAAWSTAAYAPAQLGPGQRRRPAPPGLPVADRVAHPRLLPAAAAAGASHHGRRRRLHRGAAARPGGDPAARSPPTDARHYRDALMLWPSPHCALEYQRMFVRNQFRGAGPPTGGRCAVPYRPCCPCADRRTRSCRRRRWRPRRCVRARHELVSLPGVGHLPHEEAPEQFTRILLSGSSLLPPPPPSPPSPRQVLHDPERVGEDGQHRVHAPVGHVQRAVDHAQVVVPPDPARTGR